jgi:hypothetical protein
MLTESARMSSAAEARYRVQAPNSLPRSIKVIALDATGDAVVRRLAEREWQHTTFLTASSPAEAIRDAVNAADLVVLLAGPGGHADAASVVGTLCSDRRVMTTSFIVGAAGASNSALSKTLAQLRPWSLMVVIATNDEYIDDMMTALRAS